MECWAWRSDTGGQGTVLTWSALHDGAKNTPGDWAAISRRWAIST